METLLDWSVTLSGFVFGMVVCHVAIKTVIWPHYSKQPPVQRFQLTHAILLVSGASFVLISATMFLWKRLIDLIR